MMDYRETLTQAEAMELQNRALQAFHPRKEENGELI
jgi:20S proteasome alpha/beta subunit